MIWLIALLGMALSIMNLTVIILHRRVSQLTKIVAGLDSDLRRLAWARSGPT